MYICIMTKQYFQLLVLTVIIGLTTCQKEKEPSLFVELKDMNELVLAEVRIEKTVIIDDPDIHFKEIGSQSGIFPDAIDWVKRKTSLGKRIGIYSFGTYLSASIDLNELTQEHILFDHSKKHCTIWLPPVRIKERGRDFDVKTEHERVSIYRTPLTPQEKAKAKNEAGRILSEEIRNNGDFKRELTQNATARAQTYFRTLLAGWGYEATILFREEKP